MKLFLVSCLFILSATVDASSYRNEANFQWFIQNHDYIDSVIEANDSVALIPITSIMWEIWKARDGAIGGEISTTMAKLTIAKPGLMLSIFEENPHMFRDWLDELQSPMFTDFSGHELDDLNILRTDLIEVMTDYSENGDPRLTQYAKEIERRLIEIEVRVVD